MKTIRTLAASVAIAAACGVAPAHAYLCGDLNGSKDVSAADALSALKLSVGQSINVDCGRQYRTLVTSQTHCSDSVGNATSCAGTGQDGELRKGAPRAFKDNGDGTVTDRGTGLQWELFDDAGGIHDQDAEHEFAAAFLKVALLNLAQFAGHDDWRVPNIRELMTLADLDRTDPGQFVPLFLHDCTPGCAVPACACIALPSYQWSSTTNQSKTTEAWAIESRFGNPFTQGKYLDTYITRAVRGGFTAQQIAANAAFAKSCADVNASDTISSSDALAILRKSVGQEVELGCILRAATLVTGQTDCFNSDGLAVPCTGTGQDGEFERGVARSFNNNGNGTVTDNVTGLVWEILSGDNSIHDSTDLYTWSGALDTKIPSLNEAEFAGQSDWRLPNFFELASLVNFGSETSATYDTYFNNDCQPDCANTQCSCLPGSDALWSSTTVMAAKKFANRVDLVTGADVWEDKTHQFNARGVRGGD